MKVTFSTGPVGGKNLRELQSLYRAVNYWRIEVQNRQLFNFFTHSVVGLRVFADVERACGNILDELPTDRAPLLTNSWKNNASQQRHTQQ